MKLKYYLRGLGIGIIVTTIILAISFSKREKTISDEEIMARALQLGMVMQEDAGEPETDTKMEPQSEGESETDTKMEPQSEGESETDTETGTEPQSEGESETDTETGTDPQTAAEAQPETGDGTETAGGTADSQAADTYRLTIHSGDVCRVICENLEDNGVVSDAEALRRYLFEAGYASNIRAGAYDIPYGASHEEIVQILKAGPLN